MSMLSDPNYLSGPFSALPANGLLKVNVRFAVTTTPVAPSAGEDEERLNADGEPDNGTCTELQMEDPSSGRCRNPCRWEAMHKQKKHRIRQ